MKPIHQTKFGDKVGNCFAACLATVLDIPLDAIPDFPWAEQWESALAWLWGRGYTAVEVSFRPNRVKFSELFERIGIRGRGLVIVSGKSPRGEFDHSVVLGVDEVARKAKFVHDPHPSGDWLDDVHSLMFLQPIKCECRM